MDKSTSPKKQQPPTRNVLPYLAVAGVVVAAAVAFVLNIPEPKLDWQNFVLPMVNRYVGIPTSSPDQMSTKPLAGFNVVISGATSGIGKGAVKGMIKLGANVIAIGRNATKLEMLQDEMRSTTLTTVMADYNDLDTVAHVADEITQKVDHIDILLNNAGIHEGAMLLHNPVSKQGYDRIFSVNYLAHVLLTEKLAPALNKSPQKAPIIAQMSSSFHWVGDWSDLIPTANGNPPPASQPGGTGGIFRTQRGYGNSKLAMIFHARALKRRNPELQRARIVSICPAWVGTNIMPTGLGHQIIKYLGFKNDGWGIASTLYAMFSDEDPQADYFSNSRALNLAPAISNEMAHAPWTFALGLRDFGSFLMAFSVLGVQKLMPIAEPSIPSPVTYNEHLQDQIYDWSKNAVADWL